MTKPRPLLHLHEYSRKLKRIWREIEALRAARNESNRWPDWCYCPSGEVITLLYRARSPMVSMAARIATLAAWRVTQRIYRYDATMLEELWNTPIAGELPTELLHRLPDWCVYVEIGRIVPMIMTRAGESGYLHGVFVHIDLGYTGKHEQVRFVFDYDFGLVVFALDLVGTLEQSLHSVRSTVEQTMAKTSGEVDIKFALAGRLSARVLSVVLYLCSVEPDLTDSEGIRRVPQYPTATCTKKRGTKARLPAAEAPSYWHVGYRMGAALRSAKERARSESATAEEANASPVGHIRRAHWHTYWLGPMKEPERRRRVLKWLPPIAVNLDDLDELIATIRPVTQ